jgi:5-formyltetrahydrofolate cyclo-ligase
MEPEPSIRSDKAVLRECARTIRSSLTPAQIERMSGQVCSSLIALIDGRDPLMVYVSKPLEVHTRSLLEQLLKNQRKVVVPIIEKETRTLRLSYLKDTAHLVESTFSVPEPIGHELPARPDDVKTVIVPMLAFDKSGHRLGYGAGYYDRFLSKNPHLTKIGLAFSCQQVTGVPFDENDIRMDFIITEKGILDCRI